MKIACHNANLLNLPGISFLEKRRFSTVLVDWSSKISRLGSIPFLQSIIHSLCLADRLVAALSAGQYAKGLRIFRQVGICPTQPFFQNDTGPALLHLCTQHNNIGKLPLLLQKMCCRSGSADRTDRQSPRLQARRFPPAVRLANASRALLYKKPNRPNSAVPASQIR